MNGCVPYFLVVGVAEEVEVPLQEIQRLNHEVEVETELDQNLLLNLYEPLGLNLDALHLF